jgi:two-component system response regulator YesN
MKLQVRLFPLEGKGEIHSIDGADHSFCRMVRSCSPGRERCLQDINRAIQIALKTGEPYIFQCHTDLIEFTAALPNGGKSLSALVCGPILLRHLNPFMKQHILNKVKGFSPDEALLIRTLEEVPVFPERRVQAAADLLFMIANYFSKVDSASQRIQREITRQQALLAEGLFLSKQSESHDAVLGLSYLESRGEFHKEKRIFSLASG